MMFNIDDYKGKYVMHCKTEEEAEVFCRYLVSIGVGGNQMILIFQKTIGITMKNQRVMILIQILILGNSILKKTGILFLKWKIL
jgi:hypothetical protein